MNDLFVINKNRTYKKALKREIRSWSVDLSKNQQSENVLYPHKFTFKGSEYSLDNNLSWIEPLKKILPVKKILVLGGGTALFEEHLQEMCDEIYVFDIVYKKFGSKGNSKIKYHYGDLNFIELKENKYDLIIAKSILHHIINLEHLLFQANKALTEAGRLVVFEYIGENKQQWSKAKCDFLTSSLRKRFDDIEFVLPIKPAPLTNLVPFESIRSSDILDVIKNIFPDKNRLMEETWNFFRFTFENHLFHCGGNTKIDYKKKSEIIEYIEYLDSVHRKTKNNNMFIPTMLYGIYAKNMYIAEYPQFVGKWTPKIQKKQLKIQYQNLDISFLKKIKRFIRDLML